MSTVIKPIAHKYIYPRVGLGNHSPLLIAYKYCRLPHNEIIIFIWFYVLRIDYDNPLQHCSDGSLPGNPTTILDKRQYDDTDLDVQTLIALYMSHTLLLPNGMASVGDSGKSLTYFKPEEFCIQQALHHNVTLLTCAHNASRPVLRRCLPFGFTRSIFRNESYPKLQMSTFDQFDPDYVDGYFDYVELEAVDPVYISEKPSGTCKLKEMVQTCESEFHPAATRNMFVLTTTFGVTFDFPTEWWCLDTVTMNGDLVSKALLLEYCDSYDTMRICFTSVAAVFNGLTALVHLVTWPLQNIHGRTLCCCTLGLFLMQVCYAIENVYPSTFAFDWKLHTVSCNSIGEVSCNSMKCEIFVYFN